MNFSFENQGTRTYLVYAVAEDDALDSMSLGMLTNNKIPGLAHALFTQRDSAKFIKYDVSAKVSVKQFFNGQVNKKRLIGVFNGIVDAMLSAEEYMIDVNSIMLDLDYIFADVSTCETVLVRQITNDQTFVAREVALGNMTEEQAHTDERRSVLLQCIGASDDVYPDMFFGDVHENAVYMLCCDGFRHEITSDEIYDRFRPDKLLDENEMNRASVDLINLNKQRQERDNITVALVRTF